MKAFWNGFWEGALPLHIVFFCVAYMLPLRKRPYWQLRYAVGAAASLLAVPLVQIIFAQMIKAEPPVFEQGMPISTKPKDGTHGYGLKIILICGNLSCSTSCPTALPWPTLL